MGIIESVQQYDLNIPVGGAQAIDVAGDRVQFLSALDPFAQIEIRPNFAQGNITLRPGQGFRFSEQVTRWIVFNRAAVPVSGYLLIGSGDFFDQRIAGTVDVIDGGKARTLGNQAFTAYVVAPKDATVGTVPQVQLWNPAGSGKRLVVEQITLAAQGGASADSHIGFLNSPLTYTGEAVSGFGYPGMSKMSGGATSVAMGRYKTDLPSMGASFGFGVYNASGATTIFKPNEPFIVLPGWGLVAEGVYNTRFGVSFEYFEESA